MLVLVGGEVLMGEVVWVGGLAVVEGKVILQIVAVVGLGLEEIVGVGVGAVIYHNVLVGLFHWAGKQSLYFEGLFD